MIDLKRTRTIITTDGEVDDMNSFIRFLYYANEFDVEGIILTSSIFHYSGDQAKGIAPYRWTGTDWMERFYNSYEQIFPNLSVHAKGYPTAGALRQVTKIGNITQVGEMTEVTEGSEWIVSKLLDDDERPIYIQTWGGTNTTARALKTIEETYKHTADWKSIQKKVYQKAILVIILDQDVTLKDYIHKAWPELTIIKDIHNFWHFAYGWNDHESVYNSRLKGQWLRNNIQKDHGPLLEQYALVGDGKWIEGEIETAQFTSEAYLEEHPELSRYDFLSEGDSPSFLMLFKNGLQNPEFPEYGGWGGRFVKEESNHYVNQAFDYNPASNRYETEYSLIRWFNDLQDDFAARADWGISPEYSQANHAPEVTVVDGNTQIVTAGEQIQLKAKAVDPDGDNLTYDWWVYQEAGTYGAGIFLDVKVQLKKVGDYTIGAYLENLKKQPAEIVLEPQDNGQSVLVTIPEDANSGDTIHVIITVADDGIPSLKSHQRIVLVVR